MILKISVDLFKQVCYLILVQTSSEKRGGKNMAKYTEEVKQLLELVGGKENISAVSPQFCSNICSVIA